MPPMSLTEASEAPSSPDRLTPSRLPEASVRAVLMSPSFRQRTILPRFCPATPPAMRSACTVAVLRQLTICPLLSLRPTRPPASWAASAWPDALHPRTRPRFSPASRP